MKSITLFFILSVIANHSFGQWEQLNGPRNNFGANKIFSIDSLLLVSVSCGTYYSLNDGATWTALNNNQFTTTAIFKNAAYANLGGLTQLYDASRTLNQINISNTPFINSSATGLFANQNTICGINDNYGYSPSTLGGFYYSADGRNWIDGSNGLGYEAIPPGSLQYDTMYIRDLYSIDGNSNYLFLGTVNGIFRSPLNNYQWENAGAGTLIESATSVLCKDSVVIVTSQFADPILDYEIQGGAEIYKSNDNGNTWTAEYTIPTCTVNEIKNINDTFYISTSGQGLYASYDLGNTWARVNTSSFINIYSVEEHDNQHFLATDGGIYKNLNQLTNTNNNILCSVIDKLVMNDSCLAALTAINYQYSDVSVSKDDGTSWKNVTSWTLNDNIDIVAVDNEFLISLTASGSTLSYNYLTNDNGETWHLKSKIPNYSENTFIESDGTNILANYFSLSTDTGNSWNSISIPAYTCLTGSILFTDSDIYFAGCSPEQVIKTSDLGKTWQTVNNGITSQTCYSLGYFQGILFVVGDNNLFRSFDEGASWHACGLHLPSGSAINNFTSDSNNIYACTNSDVYFSSDSGKTWNDITEGLPILSAPGSNGCLLTKDGYLYYGTTGLGIWRRPTQNLPLSLAQTKPPQPLTLFPNPTTGELYISTPSNNPIQQIDIINVAGQLILSTTVTGNHINISQLPQGFYIVRVASQGGNYYSKIVKQ